MEIKGNELSTLSSSFICHGFDSVLIELSLRKCSLYMKFFVVHGGGLIVLLI